MTDVKDDSLDYIYLQPAEAACPSEGRLWCEDDDPSGLDGPWVQYIRADIHQRKIERLEQAKAQQSAEVARLRDDLIHIHEYWNRDSNEQAMSDALWHIIDVAKQALKRSGGDQ